MILEDVARFRALTSSERIRSVRSLLAGGAFLMSRSPKADWTRQYSEQQKNLERRSIRQFIERHAR